jgi:Skp family chaperone for outer membrane proteins
MKARYIRAKFVAHYLKGNTMKKVIQLLIAFFAMVSFAYADPKPAAAPIDAANVTVAVDEQTTDASKSKKDNDKHDKHDKKEKKDKKHKKDHAEDSGDDQAKNKDAKDADEADHHDMKKEKKSKKEHKHD